CKRLPYVGLEHIEKDSGRFSAEFTRGPETLLASKFRFSSEHVLYGKLRPYLNKVALPDFDGVCTTEILPILPFADRLDRNYLYAVLLSRQFVEWASANVSGANLPRLDPKRLLTFQVPLPSVADQKRIAAILKGADRLRHARRYVKQLSDTFLPPVFVAMFGDPVKNPMRWKVTRVGDLGEVQTGNTPPRTETRYYGNHIEWIKSDNIIQGQMYVERSREMLSAEGLKVARAVSGGSILVTCIAGSPTSIGNVAIANRTVAFNQQINSVTPKSDVHPFFLYGLFLVAKPLVQRSTTLGMKRIITKSKFESLVLFKPPIQLQERFAQIVHRYERLLAQQREAERQAELLFQTLLDRAFWALL
ncbi:MAG: restriction endonuclease subunit S, partial [Terriglobia bacterium]